MARKTVKLLELIHIVNVTNATSTHDPMYRHGQNVLLENVLMGANVYAGYGYLHASDLKGAAAVELPGIKYIRKSDTREVSPKEFWDALVWENESRKDKGLPPVGEPSGITRIFPDESRRRYYIHSKLHPKR